MKCFDPQALTSLTDLPLMEVEGVGEGFDPQALTSLTNNLPAYVQQMIEVSIHRLLRA